MGLVTLKNAEYMNTEAKNQDGTADTEGEEYINTEGEYQEGTGDTKGERIDEHGGRIPIRDKRQGTLKAKTKIGILESRHGI